MQTARRWWPEVYSLKSVQKSIQKKLMSSVRIGFECEQATNSLRKRPYPIGPIVGVSRRVKMSISIQIYIQLLWELVDLLQIVDGRWQAELGAFQVVEVGGESLQDESRPEIDIRYSWWVLGVHNSIGIFIKPKIAICAGQPHCLGHLI